MSISLSNQFAALVYAESHKAGNLFQAHLSRPLGSDMCLSHVIVRLADIDGLRFALSLHCQSELCEFSADEAQTLFSMLDIAAASLERIK